MDKRLKITALIFAISLFFHGMMFSQQEHYRFRHLTTKEGLPSNTVNSIIKDRYGFIWFGTTNGLASYDGYDFRVFNIPEDTAFPDDRQAITDLLEDGEGNLWIGTLKRGLWHFNQADESFTGFIRHPGDSNSLSHNTVNVVYKDRGGNLWIGTNGGLNKYDPENKQFISFYHDTVDGDHLEDQVHSIFEDNVGKMWIGTADGVFEFDPTAKSFSHFDLWQEAPGKDYRRVTCILQDEKGNIWFGTYWGLVKYDAYTHERTNYLPEELMNTGAGFFSPKTYISNIFIESITESGPDQGSVLWIAAKWGLNRFDPESGKFDQILINKNDPDAISTTYLKEIYLDRSGLLWIGTASSGVEKLNTGPNPFQRASVKLPEEKNNLYPACFYEGKDETIWIGVYDAGLLQYDRDLNLIGHYAEWKLGENAFDERQHNIIDCIWEDPGQILWLGYLHWGLVIFERDRKKFMQVGLQDIGGTPATDIVKSIIRDHSGVLWIGTMQGLFNKRPGDDIFAPARIVRHADLSGADIFCLFEDSRRNLWISTWHHGLFCLHPEERDSLIFTQYRVNQEGFYGNYVTEICEDRTGQLWFGTDIGLCKFNSLEGQFEPDTVFNEGYGGCIINLFADDHNNLWILHAAKGLVRYQPYSGKATRIKVFDKSNGMPFDKFPTNHYQEHTFYQCRDGRFFLAGVIGRGESFLWFHPDSIRDNTNVPRVLITDFMVKNKAFSLDSNISLKGHITLNHNQNFFTFGFSALDYVEPEKNQYAYYLEGYEDDWIYSGDRRFANYTGVPPGEYTFRVKGSNNDGYWNEEGARLHITILPPFWKTWMAYVLYGLILLSIIFSITYYYLRRQRLLDKLALEEMEAEKLKELDGLKTRFFTNISHEFRTPLTLILGPVQQVLKNITDPGDKENLSIVLKNARRLKELVNQLLSLSKLESGKMQLEAVEVDLPEFVRSYLQSFESLARQKKIALDFSSVPGGINAYIDKEKMAQLLNNLLSNAFKFTPAGGRVVVEVNRQPSTVHLPDGSVKISIADTGPGIAPEKLHYIFDRFYQVNDSISREQEGTGIGLSIAREMVKLHHGEIGVESAPGKGTTFRIILPLGKEHLREEEIISIQEPDLTPIPQYTLPPGPPDMAGQALSSRRGVKESEAAADAPILLIVEDNPDMRAFIRGYFEEEYQVLQAGDGQEGLTMATENIPDIIVSDVMMPRMDGYDFCQKLKTDEKTCHIPVILLTARASKESRLEGLETGADDFITKPFDGEELQVRVKNLVSQRKKLSEHYRKGFESMPGRVSEEILSMDEKFLRKAQSVVETNLSDPDYGVNRFASDMALSRVQLHRKLRALVDQSVTEFIRTIRLNYAIILMQKRAGTISEIAYDAGFNSATWFTVSFKKKFGISPKEYLDRLNNK